MDTMTLVRDIAVAVIALAGGSGILVAIINRKNAERDSVSNSTEKVVKAAGELVEITKEVIYLKESDLRELISRVETLNLRLKGLESKVTMLEAKYSYLLSAARKLLKGIEILVSQIDSYGKHPLWLPSNEIREFILHDEEIGKENLG